MMDTAVERFAILDVLLSNAGISSPKPLPDHDPEKDWHPVLTVNQTSVY